MYTPELFVVEDRRELVAFMREHSFATLAGIADGRPIATHLPFTLHETADDRVLLTAHMAKANPHWKAFGEGDALVIFSGPHAYVSPSLYTSQLSVPTWNYAAVHAYGIPRIVPAIPVLEHLVGQHDPAYRTQWDSLPEEFKAKMVEGIVAFEISITRIEGKYKLSQNRPKADQARVTQSFSGTELGDLMARWLDPQA